MITTSWKSLSKFREPKILHSTSKQAAFIFAIALIVRLAIAIHQHAWTHNLRAEMEREAISMATTGVLGNAFSLPTGPSATVPPLYPLIMSGIFRVFGSGVWGESVKVLLTCLVSSTQYALLPWLGKRLGLAAPIGLAAGLLGALVPLNPYIEIQGDFENHLSALLFLILLGWTELAMSRNPTLNGALGLGFFYGVCALTSPALGPICLISFAVIVYQHRQTVLARPQIACAAALASILVVAPWGIRNYIELGSPILTRSNFGLEFSLANNDRASPLMTENAALYACCHPLESEDQAREVQRLGEVGYNKRLKDQTLAWVREHPYRFAKLTALRFWYFWAPKAPEELRTLAFRLLTLLSIPGLWFLWRTNRRAALFLFVPLVVYPLPYYLVQMHFRYRYPFNFVFLLLSCVAVYFIAKSRVKSRQMPVEENLNVR